ncbi:MAG: hypothetical protein GWN53_11160 [Gammaproteobacteria bacterium]|uniref:DZANK-type domain-containing protein n=1 Tax=Candidatus Kutchimonas denitrificans TaxID=3056748 RepID=A0AAE4Z7M8_9BACT|nr:hypothetical protein [Gemmatimonadota bacterium]NIR75143.1 hypothetical protein [Candidatus Kutchimonas denitrificans]NIU52953.1 hypothetical protein [Gemmatimonadota bacterium]NIV52422.1 hypothetical protein [Gammaproteobacteria bacterium]NIY44842.1 hypothetical protein [Gemmatimonadota bacterium]
MECSICGAYIEVDARNCAGCGAPADDRAASGERSECALCEEILWSLAEKCVHCGGKGYPALRPRLGDKSLGAPESEVNA